jgi:hypothetical protein
MALNSFHADIGDWILMLARFALLVSLMALFVRRRQVTRGIMAKLDTLAKSRLINKAKDRSVTEAPKEPLAGDRGRLKGSQDEKD